ncbi:hypothetical protein SAMN02745885_02680 [Carboxydocella sporoproducens DSM 16521]|uniref:Uncharacterized protein n=2 Tax=Carboxydocella TaxID=178898 RepID=A0A1T4SHY8_9FIRM|nr:hypothetical protein CFE_0433 [Carboxydocella thermautotrophica]SKA27451.1 hypothetical protein SAMN02745885_02680 [Carboxydocella sporoproducens DSM 16521]
MRDEVGGFGSDAGSFAGAGPDQDQGRASAMSSGFLLLGVEVNVKKGQKDSPSS